MSSLVFHLDDKLGYMLIRVTIVELYTLSTSAGVDIEFLCDLFHRPLVASLVCSPVTSRLFQLPGNLKTTGIRFWNIILQCTWLEMLSGRLGLSRGGDAVTGAVGGCFCTRGVVSRTQQSKRNRPSCYHTHTHVSPTQGLRCRYGDQWGHS